MVARPVEENATCSMCVSLGPMLVRWLKLKTRRFGSLLGTATRCGWLRAAVHRHDVRTIHVEHRDHLARCAFVKPVHQRRTIGNGLEARALLGNCLSPSTTVPTQAPSRAFILSNQAFGAIADFSSPAGAADATNIRI